MEFKINLTQIIGALIQTAGYLIFFLSVTWRASKRVTKLEENLAQALKDIEKTNTRMEKTFDKIDRTFERIDDKLDKKETKI